MLRMITKPIITHVTSKSIRQRITNYSQTRYHLSFSFSSSELGGELCWQPVKSFRKHTMEMTLKNVSYNIPILICFIDKHCQLKTWNNRSLIVISVSWSPSFIFSNLVFHSLHSRLRHQYPLYYICNRTMLRASSSSSPNNFSTMPGSYRIVSCPVCVG